MSFQPSLASGDTVLNDNRMGILPPHVIPSEVEESYMKQYYLYIMASPSEVLYIGVTNDLKRRVYQHQNKLIDGFTKKYNCINLLYYEISNDINVIISREKQIKNWNRQKKLNLIQTQNPDFIDTSSMIN